MSASPAKDIWRVVSNYKKEDVEEYLESCTGDVSDSSAAGISKTFDWDDIADEKHPLEFDADEHKILEGELVCSIVFYSTLLCLVYCF
jgi:hypothetical protein